MSAQRYQRVNAQDEDDSPPNPSQGHHLSTISPSSPPPSFHSRSSSPSSRRLLGDASSPRGTNQDADQTLADAFDGGSDSEGEDEPDDRQRLMRANPELPSFASGSGNYDENDNGSGNAAGAGAASSLGSHSGVPSQPTQQPRQQQQQSGGRGGLFRRTTVLPSFLSSSGASRSVSSSNDGVFANLAAKPERGEKNEDLPPSYEEAAADATPPYWETTILAPGLSSDEVFVDGLPVGSIFSFVWNAMISMSFQVVGFILTYLLHTTHAAKNGSRAGLGLTLVQYGFYMKGGSDSKDGGDSDQFINPPDPNSHSFDPGAVADGSAGGDGSGGSMSSISTSEWISYVLMIVGWFVLIRAISDFLRARRHEQLVLQSPDRGLAVPVIAEGERAETVV